ncbi:MAG: hypothetical protein LBO04_00195 [Spirochaetaceae bacterium]|jgi:hypothetical protein|nr:hypothetical protein [Spirochaetaceae bacterium]
MLHLTYADQLKMLSSLNWDYLVPAEDMLAVAEGRLDKAGPFDKKFLFARFLQYVPWHRIVAFWGVEQIKELYTPDIKLYLFPRDTRDRYDFIIGVLRGEPVSAARWGPERSEQLRHTVFSYRWYSAKPRVLQSPVFG